MRFLSILDAGAVIHTHSKHAVMATLFYPGTEFRITHQEMIKGIKKGLKCEKIFQHILHTFNLCQSLAHSADDKIC